MRSRRFCIPVQAALALVLAIAWGCPAIADPAGTIWDDGLKPAVGGQKSGTWDDGHKPKLKENQAGATAIEYGKGVKQPNPAAAGGVWDDVQKPAPQQK